MLRQRNKREHPTLCSKCGTDLAGHHWECVDARLCPRHLREAKAASPPFACRPEDIGTPGESPADRGLCAECEHLHMPGERCTTLTATFECSYGEIIKDTPPYACGCRA